ncbi:MAG: YceI family protein [Firmicutes bacterium]|nr:YceI family protein [Bacillota bacterium]
MAKTNWTVDAAHSSVEFSVKHMMIATVKGNFGAFEASISADAHDLTTADIEFTIDVASIDTRNQDRDNHLRSGDFLDVENHPKMVFKSTSITKRADGEYDVTGDLTLRGTTKPVTLVATFEGEGKDPWGNQKVGFSAEGSLNRSDFGLTYNAALETGGVLIGDKIKISVLIEAAHAA